MGRCAVGRVRDRPGIQIAERFERRGRRDVPIEIARSRRSRQDDAHRRAFRKGSGNRAGPGADPDIDAPGDDGLQGLAAAIGIEQLQCQAMLREDAGPLSDGGKTTIPVVWRPHRDLESILTKSADRKQRDGGSKRCACHLACDVYKLAPYYLHHSTHLTPRIMRASAIRSTSIEPSVIIMLRWSRKKRSIGSSFDNPMPP